MVLNRTRVHPFPFRTRKLSSFLPKILVWRRTGKIGNANTRRNRLTVPSFLPNEEIGSCGLQEERSLASTKKFEKLEKSA